MRGAPVVGGVVALALVGGTVGVVAMGEDGGGPPPTSTRPRATATVQRTDLETREELAGTLGHGEAEELAVARPGTVTALPEVGTVVGRGQVVAEVDGRPVPLLLGDRPLWRSLTVDDEGPDVTIVEENLAALGYDGFTVDDTYTSSTADAVEEWQEDIGLDPDGVVTPEVAVVRPGPVRVASHVAGPGAASGGPVLTVTTGQQRVTVALEADRQGEVAAGDEVEVTLPSGAVAPGVIYAVGTEVTPGDEQAGTEATVEVVVVLDDPAVGEGLDQAPVEVSVVASAATDVLAVPVQALLALAEGGFAVERVTGAGTELVAVEPGAAADGLVEVTGDVAEGDEVVVPA